jgi:hypothetical protein
LEHYQDYGDIEASGIEVAIEVAARAVFDLVLSSSIALNPCVMEGQAILAVAAVGTKCRVHKAQ